MDGPSVRSLMYLIWYSIFPITVHFKNPKISNGPPFICPITVQIHINIFSKKIQLNYFKNYFVPNKYIFRKYNPFYNILFIFIYFIRYVPISKLFYYFIVLFFHTPFFIPVVLSLYEPNICFL